MWSVISAAGWPIWPLIFASIIALAIVFERAWALRSSTLFPSHLVAEVCKNLAHFREAQHITRLSKHSPLGEILASAITAHLKHQPFIEAIQDKAAALQTRMNKHLDLLSLIASAAPLMGLLGTVVGMIEIFAIQGASSQTPESLAAGIAVALYNTAFGLIVAIPALVAYRLFNIRINNLLNQLEEMLKPFEDLMTHQQHAAAKPMTQKVV